MTFFIFLNIISARKFIFEKINMTTSLENKAQELDVKTTLENMNLPQDQVEDILKAISETINKLKAHNLELENFEILDNLSDLKKNITN